MKTFLLLVLCMDFALAQSSTKQFTYRKLTTKGSTLYLLITNDTTTITPYKQGKDKITKATVKKDGQMFYIISKKKERLAYIQTENGERKSTILYDKKNVYDVTLPSGTKYERVKGANNNEWRYLADGKEVFAAKITKVNGKRTLEYRYADLTHPDNQWLEIASHDYAIARIRQKAMQPALIGTAAALAVLGAASARDSTPDVD